MAGPDTPYSITPARYAKGKMVIHARDGRDGMKGRVAYLAEALGGRYVGRSHGYVISPAGAQKFEVLYAAGFDAKMLVFAADRRAVFLHRARDLRDLTAAQAVKLAKEAGE